ncbi:OOP family OmpA-OmpF porin [Roseovarius sp. MBR-154]|jgi:outer membrane protein OmpA-like peptidoglycan-associated protein
MPASRFVKSAMAGLGLCVLGASPAPAQERAVPDLMTFAQGVLPLSVELQGTDMRVDMAAAISLIDGNPGKVSMTGKPGGPGDAVLFTYSLPSPTRFSRFAVPGIAETPSPSQTFFATVVVEGASASTEGPWLPLASGRLETHAEAGLQTDLTLAPDQPEVRWLRLRLSDGIRVERDKTFFEFSELIGEGTQRDAELATGFGGIWKGRGVKLELAQEGAVVSGCYDANGRLSGTVEGRVLRALGQDAAGIKSQFILMTGSDGTLRGLRSSNGAPFKPYDGATVDGPAVCPAPAPPHLGCGSIIHGIGFDYDSDVIRATSQPLIARLHGGLSAAGAARIEIIGHASAEGAADYNRDLSQRRAQSVVAALVALGLDPVALSAAGRGEDEPIASNDDEAGRTLNRRVEVRCED